ncbi:apolipoprotein Bb, tandem duplicate 1 [Tachysurus fulvidraco]|uniref:apolipoprotein Bb, tandem duplicate 1 n=1 Tax=Tachysurus fulvidraco TaxID=1234273 RepID=UPI001FEDC415|nr:apolipoprotein Bb, tandem duplicate 1 [Tachysurus fulvidraco]
MGDNKLFVLLLLYAIVVTDAQDDGAVCLLAKRYKSFHKYEYLYESESLNTLNGAINGPKISCKVEIEVPGTCHFNVHTTDCTLSEVISVDADGNPIFGSTAGADTFNTQMEKNPLKVIVEGENDIKLFPEDGELINILNVKRGIISALAVPVLQEEKNKQMPTIYGLCETDYTVNTREDIATDVTLNRDLSRCDQFRPIKDHTSPLAIIKGMHYPLSQLIRSKQTCSYKFDNTQKHMTSGVCTEDHLLVPFSHEEKYGVASVGKQTLSLLGVTEYNERVFDHNEANMKTLHLDESVDMSPSQDKNAILAVLRELSGLSHTTDGQKRAHLAYKLVAVMRKMNADTLSDALPEALDISPSLTYQVLFQCGTPECSGALMQVLRTFKSSSTEIDAAVYAMGMVPNPSRVLVKEMLEMAKFKPSKLIYYATSNAVRRLYKAEGRVTPEIQAVADYALENIGDCTGDQEHIYLTLRVIGNMAEAVGAASPALKSAVIQCINQAAASTEVQQAAIQVFRLTAIPQEGRTVLKQVLLEETAPVQKRIAAYLILMKDPQPSELALLVAALPSEGNLQVKSFVISHLTNILSSTAAATKELRQKILDTLQGNEVGNPMDATKFSRNYKIGSLEGNMIFDKENELPTEVMLEMTLNAFGYDIDMVEFGMEGKGLEPIVEALFGPNGFFPDTVMKTVYYATDKMPSQVNEILKNMIPALNERKKRQVPKNIIREISKNVDKLIKNLKSQDAPEAMLYLRLLGAELGYLKTNDLEEMASSVTKVAENLLKMFPKDCVKSLFSSTDNELFLHYIFMDNEFYLPTGPGLPLRVALSGTFASGVKGGLRISPDMSEIEFMPSAGVEFVTEIGAHFPDYVHSGLEMHTNIYHESGMRAKVAMTRKQIKLTIPIPKNPVKVLSVSNSMVSVTGDKATTIPAMTDLIDVNKCTPFFPGVKYCSALQYSDAMFNDASPYFPLSGDSKFAIELHPTADVSEYTATINYDYEDNTDKVTFDIKAEGTAFEATSKFMFNRKEYTVSAELQIPDFDIEAGIRIGTADPSTKVKGTHSIQIDLINKNIPMASLTGLAKIEAMKDAMLQVQLLVPDLEVDGKLTASLKRDEELEVELKSDFKLTGTYFVQKLILKYDNEKIEAQIKSDVNYKTENIEFELLMFKAYINDLLDQTFGQTRTKVCDILASSIEATNSYIEASNIPYVENLRVPSLHELEMPKMLFLNTEADAKYHFGKHYYTITLPMPLGGKSSKDLNFPPALTTPNLDVPQLGLNIASVKVPMPEVFVPKTITLSLPTLGKAELAGKLHSNLYDLEATLSAGKDSDENQGYSAKVGVTGSGPVDLLSVRIEGSAFITGMMTDTLRAEMNTAFNHKLIDARFNISEEIQLMEKISITSSSKLDVNSPFNVKFSLEHAGQIGLNIEEIFGDNHLKGSFVTGPIVGDVTLTQSVALFPFKPEARIDSTIEVSSTPFQAQNKIVASFVNGELSVVSNSAAFEDMLTHNAEFTLVRSKCAIKSDTKASALGLNIHNVAEANIGVEEISVRIETTSSHSEDHINSLMVAALNSNGLVVNSDASAKLDKHTATHKASVTLDKNGLTTSGTTSVNSLFTLQNTFSGILHSSKFSLTAETKGTFKSMSIDNINSISVSMPFVALSSKSRVGVAPDIWYIYDMSLQAEPYTVTASVKSHSKIASEGELKNTCEIKLADLTGNAKCSTTGKLLGAHMNHDIEMEIVGLGVRINNDARFTSQLGQFSTNLQATAAPFTLNVHAIANGDGELHLFGKHSAQIYNKFLLKAEPLALAHSHECRLSTTHELYNEVIFEANFDKKVDTQLTFLEQSAKIIVKSNINNNVFKQEFSAYNNHERIGLEVSGGATFRESQDVSISALIQYDKNTENHVINLPILESLPAILENLKITSVTLVEALQDYIKREEFIVKIQNLLQHLTDTITEFNLEEKVEHFKRSLVSFLEHCPISTVDLEAAVHDLEFGTFMGLAVVTSRVHEIKEQILSGALSSTVMEKITLLNKEYDIKGMILVVIEAVENVIKQIDMTKLKDSSIPVFYDAEKLNDIKLHLQQYLTDLKSVITDFDKDHFVDQMQNIIKTTEMYTENLIAKFPIEDIIKIVDTLKEIINQLDIFGKYKVIYNNFREVVMKYELHKRTEEFLDKVLELIKQFKIDKTINEIVKTLKSIQIPFPQMLHDAFTYLKSTDIKQIIDDLNRLIEAWVHSVKSFEYNTFVDEANQKLSELTADLNKIILSLELPQKLEATREFINYALSSMSAFFEQLGSSTVSDVIKIVTNLIDTLVLNDIKTIAKNFKQNIINLDIRGELLQALQQVSEIYSKVLSALTNTFNYYVDLVTNVLGDQQIVTELKQIIDNVVKALQTSEVEIPSFTVPLTDLVLPSRKFSLQQLQKAELPVQFNLPEFTILGSYTVPAITITYDDIKQLLLELADFIINVNTETIFNNVYIEKLTVNFPDLSTITLPVVTLPHISLPAIPKLNSKHILDIPLRIPEIKLPKIPNSLILPALGKLHGKIRVNSPIYTLSTIVELKNSTDTEQKQQFTALINSVGESSIFNILEYNLDATLHFALPKMRRLIISDTLKLIHSALTVEHKGSVALYGLSAQATAQTNVRVTTMPYTADINNNAFFAVEGGMSASFETIYKHQVNMPLLSLTSEASLTQSALVSQKGATIQLRAGNLGQGTFSLSGYSDVGTHKSDLVCNIAPTSIKLTFTGDTRLTGTVSGTLMNAVNIMVHPFEIAVDIKNKGNGKVSLQESLSTKFDIQNDYTLIFNRLKQHITNAALLRLAQNKYSYNFTLDNNNAETGIYAAMNGETDLEFLTVPFSIPETVIPVIDVTITGISDVNLHDIIGLKYLSTKPAFDVNAKIVYQKNQLQQIINLGFINLGVPAVGNLISEMSFKSSVFNLITNAGLYGDNDLVIRIGAISTSVFEELNAKLEGTSSLTLKRGLKLANALSLKYPYFEGSHDSTFTVNTEHLEAAVAMTTVANLNLPVLSIEVNHKLLADTKTHPNAASTLTIKEKCDLPIIKAVGSGEAEHILKVDATASYISVESTTKGMIDGSFLETGIVKGALDNEATLHMSVELVRSKSKTTGNVNVNYQDLKLEFDVNANSDMGSTLNRLYTVMDIVSNNEVNIAPFNTKGKHVAKATLDLAPVRSLVANVEFDMSQPTSFCDFTIYEKTAVDLTLFKQKISYITKMASPLYTTNIVVEMEGAAPIFKVVFKSSAKSPVVLLDYDLDSYLSTIVENKVLNARAKAFLEHNDFTIDFNSILTPSDPSHTMNIDITSPTFTDASLRYAAQKEGVTASISSPSVGFLGFELQGKLPAQLTSRIYSHYASAPENDIDILKVNIAADGDKKIHFHADLNVQTPKEMILGLYRRLHAISSAISNFAEKYGITGTFNTLKTALINALNDAYTNSYNHAPDLSQLSILFRNVIVQYHKVIQQLLNAAVTFLRETQIKLLGMEETTLSEICHKIRSSIAAVFEKVINAIIDNLKPHLSTVKTFRIVLPNGNYLTKDEIFSNMENALTYSVDMIKQLECLDGILKRLGQALQEAVDMAQLSIDMIQSDFLDNVAAEINTFYTKEIQLVRDYLITIINNLNIDRLTDFVGVCMELVLVILDDIKRIVSTVISMDFHNGSLKTDISFPFYQ